MTVVPQVTHISCGNALLVVKWYAKPGAETIILLHGGPGVPDEMAEVRDWCLDYMQVITFNQRGIGMDENHCTFTITDYIGDILNIAAHFNLSSFHLFGHSWGGLYAQIFADKYPLMIKSLFLCSAAPGTGRIWQLTEKEVFRYNRNRSTTAEWLAMAFNTLMGMLGSHSAYKRLFRQIIINYHKGYNVPPPDEEKLAAISSQAGLETRKNIRRYELNAEFGKTPYPVMITYGEFDAYGKSREHIFSRFPFAQSSVIPASGHTPWKHNPNSFYQVLHSFYNL